MKLAKHARFVALFVLFALLLAACGSQQTSGAEAPMAPAAAATAAPAASEAPAAAARTDTEAYDGGSTANAPEPQAQMQQFERKIIKDATMVIEVVSLDNTVSLLSNLAVQSGGYVLQTSTNFYDSSYARTANIQFAVPVERFEATLQKVREGANKIVSEGSSGVDVTQEFVDTESQIANLEATRERVRQFLSEAKNVEEALAVNQELSRLEGELGTLKGRLQYLSQRSSFSTITVEARQPLPAVEQAQAGWQAGEVLEEAVASLVELLQNLATLVIWLVIVVAPVMLPLGLVTWFVVQRVRRRLRQP